MAVDYKGSHTEVALNSARDGGLGSKDGHLEPSLPK